MYWTALWIPPVVSQLTGTPDARSGEGLEVTLVHSWPWAPWVGLLILILAGAYVLLIYLREGGEVRPPARIALAGVRLALLALVITMMYGWMRDRHRTDLPDLVFVLDDSSSMRFVDQYEDPRLAGRLAERVEQIGLEGISRINLAKSLLLDDGAGWMRDLRRRYRLKFYLLGVFYSLII